MNVDEEMVRNRCPDSVFERGQNFHRDGRILQIERIGDLVTAAVQGSNLYDVSIEFDGNGIDTRCTCPYDGVGDCKHIVAVLLELAVDPPADERDRIEAALEEVSADELREFVRDALAARPDLREQFLVQFGDEPPSVEEVRAKIEQLFVQHADAAMVTAIDFSRFFEIAEQYRERDMYLAAATVYRAIFEEIDEKSNWIDGAYDHYARTLHRALDSYIDCVLATNPDHVEFDTWAGVLEDRATMDPPINNEQFWHTLDELEERYEET